MELEKEINFVGQAVDTFVLWPKNLIKPKVTPQPYKKLPSPVHSKAPSPAPSKAPSPKAQSSKAQSSKQLTAVEKSKQRDWIAFMAKKLRTIKDNELIGVSFPKEICGVGDQVLVINKEDISCVIKGEWAINVAIMIYLRYLYINGLKKNNLET